MRALLRQRTTLVNVLQFIMFIMFNVLQFVKSINLDLMLEFKSEVIKDVRFAKMSDLFSAVEVLMKHTFFAFSPFLYVLMGSYRWSMFFLELLMKWTCKHCYESHSIWMWVDFELIVSSSVVTYEIIHFEER